MKLKGYMISPENKWVDVGFGNHEEWAEENLNSSLEDLLNAGWIRISGNSIQSAEEMSDSKIMMLSKKLMQDSSEPIVIQMGKKIAIVRKNKMGRPVISKGTPSLSEVRKLIKEEVENELYEQMVLEEQLAQKINDAVGKLVGYWKKKKEEAGKSAYILDQAATALKRSIMSSFADINKRLENNKYSDVEKQKTSADIGNYIMEQDNNPYAICSASVGREDKGKYERCIKDVKKQKRKS